MGGGDWFQDARYGMFIHWGPYSVLGRGEWVANRERMPYEEYLAKAVHPFTAEKYDPREWVKLAEDAGMRYVVLTTQHHDGFSLWDSKVNPFNAARLGPKRDLLADFAEAVHASSLKLGFYISPASWYHPTYPGAFYRDWPGESDWASEEKRLAFIADYHARVREILSGYGRVDLLWWDGCIPGNIDGRAINEEAKHLQPGILINERNGEPYDFRCSEQSTKAKPGPWESCFTLNESWGYDHRDTRWKSPASLLGMLVNVAGNAGNLLVNIGPRADGTVPEDSARILREAGAWLERNRAFLANSERSPFGWNNHRLQTTVKGNQVFLHFSRLDVDPEICWPEIKNKVLAARYLASGQPVGFRQEGDRFWLTGLPATLPDSPLCTIVLDVEGKPEALTDTTTFWIPD